MRLVSGLLALACMILPAQAEWPLEAMNRQIEQTNVILNEICSGTVIDVEERLILTAYHCITENLREIEKKDIDPKTGEIKITKVQERAPMFIEFWRRQEYDIVSSEKHIAEIKGYDSLSDTALLQVVDKGWKPAAAAPLASDKFAYLRGKTVFAVGNPAIIFDNSVTTGIISAPERKLDFGNGIKLPLFQHSASVTGGSSGGAVYNGDGEIIGTLTGGLRGADIALAVPISYAKAMIRKAGFGKILEKK